MRRSDAEILALGVEEANREAAVVKGWREWDGISDFPPCPYFYIPSTRVVVVAEHHAFDYLVWSPMTDANDAHRVADAVGVDQIHFGRLKGGWSCTVELAEVSEPWSFTAHGFTAPAALTLAALIAAGRGE